MEKLNLKVDFLETRMIEFCIHVEVVTLSYEPENLSPCKFSVFQDTVSLQHMPSSSHVT